MVSAVLQACTTPKPLPFCPFALRFKLHRPVCAAPPGGASPGVSQSRSTAGSSAGSGSGSGLAASAAMVAKIAAARELARRLTEERQAAVASATMSSLEDVSHGFGMGMQGVCLCGVRGEVSLDQVWACACTRVHQGQWQWRAIKRRMCVGQCLRFRLGLQAPHQQGCSSFAHSDDADTEVRFGSPT